MLFSIRPQKGPLSQNSPSGRPEKINQTNLAGLNTTLNNFQEAIYEIIKDINRLIAASILDLDYGTILFQFPQNTFKDKTYHELVETLMDVTQLRVEILPSGKKPLKPKNTETLEDYSYAQLVSIEGIISVSYTIDPSIFSIISEESGVTEEIRKIILANFNLLNNGLWNIEVNQPHTELTEYLRDVKNIVSHDSEGSLKI